MSLRWNDFGPEVEGWYVKTGDTLRKAARAQCPSVPGA
jgi:hypothetical protein